MTKEILSKIIGGVVLLAVIVWLGVMVWMVNKADQKQAQDEVQLQQVEAYLSAGVQLNVFPSGQQLQQLAAQKATSTK